MSQLIDTEPDSIVSAGYGCFGVLPQSAGSIGRCRHPDLTRQAGSGLPLIEQLTTAMPELRVIVSAGWRIAKRFPVKRTAVPRLRLQGCDIQILFDALRTPATAS